VLFMRMELYLSDSHSSLAPAALAAARQRSRRGLGAAQAYIHTLQGMERHTTQASAVRDASYSTQRLLTHWH
jgi:hypothetical protein